jgi:hypothetical protein
MVKGGEARQGLTQHRTTMSVSTPFILPVTQLLKLATPLWPKSKINLGGIFNGNNTNAISKR